MACIAAFHDVSRSAEGGSVAPFGYQWQLSAEQILAEGDDYVRSTTSYDGLDTLTTRNPPAATSNLSQLVLYVDREQGLVRIDWYGPEPCHGSCEKNRIERTYEYNTEILSKKYGEARIAKDCFSKCLKVMWKTQESVSIFHEVWQGSISVGDKTYDHVVWTSYWHPAWDKVATRLNHLDAANRTVQEQRHKKFDEEYKKSDQRTRERDAANF